MERLCDVLEVRRGVTAVIGGGGKTSLLYRLAQELREQGTVLLATTTRILPPAHLPVCYDRERTLRALREGGTACAGTPAAGGKLAQPAFADWITLADYTLVEADGSKGLPLKAHAPHEPVIPPQSDQTILVLGAEGFGRMIAQAAHRPALYAHLAGAEEGDTVTPALAARVLCAERLHDRVFVNQADDWARWESAVRALAGTLDCPVAAGSLRRGEWRRVDFSGAL